MSKSIPQAIKYISGPSVLSAFPHFPALIKDFYTVNYEPLKQTFFSKLHEPNIHFAICLIVRSDRV